MGDATKLGGTVLFNNLILNKYVATSGDILNMALAIGFIVVFILIFYAILIVRDTAKVIDDIAEVVSKVRKTIVEPLKAIDYIIDRAKPYIETVLENRARSKKNKEN